ncbi:addiction module toxin RelE [Caulobacter zeae]|uniref:Addiction module toxin RelE n=1 Tax=Caulobacter zeae TaxID=2055137 RepID=A0A2N5DB97_9CAUL|nr:type II toxin-antitoxin system RelE/ParE family toxin [Caulobacter zeae]PLR23338.1 addiction module toxin RelE [Caulobacter zeae]
MRSIEFDQRAKRDLMKLRRWLVSRAPSAADRAIDVIMKSVGSLAEFPDRGRRKGHGMRELYIPFGAHGYVVQYRQQGQAVVIARIRHSLERR